MHRTLTILVVGLLVAALSIGAVAPAVSAHGETDTEQSPYTTNDQSTVETPENVTEAYAAQMAQWMATRMGPEGVAAFEEETGTSIEVVAHAMAEQMSAENAAWNGTGDESPYASGWGTGSQAPSWGYGPQMPYGPHMGPGGHGPHMSPGGFGPGMGPGGFGSQSGPGGYGPQAAPGGFGSGGFWGQGQGFFGGSGNGFWGGSGGGGHGGHGMGGGMGGGW